MAGIESGLKNLLESRKYTLLPRDKTAPHVITPRALPIRGLGGVTVKTYARLMIESREFDSRSGCYQVVTTWIGDCLWTGKPSQYITNHQCQLSLQSLQGR